jgi:hemerythrin-like metal-binding protein
MVMETALSATAVSETTLCETEVSETEVSAAEVSATAWTPDLETGIGVMDEQHHQYFDLLSDYLAQAAVATTTPGAVLDLAETFSFLLRYAEEHFSTEEQVMEEVGYPDHELHREEHRYFLKHVEELYEHMRTKGFSPELSREVHYYTAEWFIEHIRLTDMKLVKFLNQKSERDKTVQNFLKKIYHSLFSKN